MANDLFRTYGNSMQPPQADANPMETLGWVKQCCENYKGDARLEVQKMLDSGQISQQQLNEVVLRAQRILGMMR